ncbi:MAG: hypothetical protein HYX52_00520 [Chloroflexi bacterium]|nr:hypothetical protein [Chloroflexota bacterium]
MVPHPRTPLGARDLRPLNAPRRLAVDTLPDDSPQAIRREGWPRPRQVATVQDRWRIDDEWWRERPIARLYFTLVLADGAALTIYHDLVEDAWYEQRG